MDGECKVGKKLQSLKARFDSANKTFIITWAVCIVFFALFIICPLINVIITPTPKDFIAVFTNQRWQKAILNTALECVCSSFLSVLIGYIYAYAVVTENIPFARFFKFIPIIHLVTPPFVGGLSFILLFGRQGFITRTLLHLDISLYGFAGLLLAQVLTFFPIAYLICEQTVRGISPSLEQAALSMGASRLHIFFTITLPLSSPGIIGALLFIAVSVLGDFGNPLIVAGRFRVLAVEIYTQLNGWLNRGTASVLGMILLLPSIILFIAQNKIQKKNISKTATIGGKTFASSSIEAQKSSLLVRIFLTLFCSLVVLAIISQFIALIAGAFQKLWGIQTDFTLSHIKEAFSHTEGLRNSLCFAFIGALCSTLLSLGAAYMAHRTECPCRIFLDTVPQLPAAIPGSLIGLALSMAASLINFDAVAFMIVIAMIVGFLPFSYRSISAGMYQIKTSIDDGASSLGANRIQVLFQILSPLIRGSLNASFIYSFVRGVGTISAVIFLISFNTPLASVEILNLAEEGNWGEAAALALILTLVTFAVLGVGSLWNKKKK